ncbi:hypothetical protein INT48_000349 [Thamnidium elegans]|uniref:Rgp1-domain-containing protein n=1 Tax=Thamnidium elegans TaxID=101142 RepID=A0A8H7VXE5_9FUNG|nr:hypothetical protein INT48_000349 [Thamnidium elegans]
MPELEGLTLSNLPSRKLSLSSLASSTFSYLTGSTTTTKGPESITDPKEWKDLTESVLDNLPSETTIELDETPRSSIDTTSIRSSIDSNLSSIPRNARLHRLSSINSFHRSNDRNEHLLWGSAQVIGQFVFDPTLINANVFTPLKKKAMYHPFGISSGGGMLTASSLSKRGTAKSRTIPVFSTPPSILFVDLNLSPGEIVNYTYKLTLPKNIPPTYRGKAMRFNYYLVIGSQRSSSSKPFGAQGQVVQIPFRVFNHVSEDGNRPIYDLMNPEIHYTDKAMVDRINIKESVPFSNSINNSSTPSKTNSRNSFIDYIDGLLEKTASNKPIHKIMQRENDLYEEEEVKHQLSCYQTISRITNINKKATFDICKNNQRVAQLHLLKSLYRLGEPIQGIVNFEGAVLPTFRISILLESQEIVDISIAQRQPNYIAKVSRKKHAGHYAFCKDNLCTSFSLAVPTSESPEFQTTTMKLEYYLKLEFITTEQESFDLVGDKNHKQSKMPEAIQTSSFDCQIPIHVFGSSSTMFGGPHIFTVQ